MERLLQDTVVQVAAAVKSRQLQEDEQLDYETDMYLRRHGKAVVGGSGGGGGVEEEGVGVD